MLKRTALTVFASLVCLCLSSAQIGFSPEFLQLLEAGRMAFNEPVEASYRDIPAEKNPFLECDFVIRSRKEKLEIRYIIEPYKESDRSFIAPHVRAVQRVVHLAANTDESIITGHSLADSTLLSEFNADWGKVFFFQPKEGFSRYKHCKMLVLFKDGCGMAYVLFLFNQPSAELDQRFLALRFRDLE
jgi:hypothetical protein